MGDEVLNGFGVDGGDAIDGSFEYDDADDADNPQFMQNRELSWLTFNERVLDQGADDSVPLLDKLNFISIFWSNLQEFFMVRVGSLTDLTFIDPPVIDSKTGMTPKEQILAIHDRCHELYPIQESYYEHVRGQLAKQGVRHLRPEDLSEEQRNYLFGLVQHNIEPFLSPQIINARHPFPHLENGKLYILVRLDDEAAAEERKKKKKEKEKGKKKKNKGAEGVVLGLIPLPHQCERVIKLPGRGFQFILLEHAIEMFVPEIFSMYKIKHTNVICVTRNADFDANQGFDEQDEDYREHMKRLLKKRARLAPVRLECERPLSPVMEKLMLKKLGLKRYQVYDTIVPLDLSFTWGLGSRLSESKRAKLSAEPFSPAWPTCFDRKRRILDQVSEQETLLFYPYESIDPFVQLLREASTDPSVVSIKITLYRLASQSHLAEALIAAADAGKEVTALFELRARFDENNNIEWSQRFEEAGCNVIYGFRDYKVHSKICCITRRTEDGVQHITQLGTGNYNEKTARLYTDLSFITTDEAFGRDAVEFFRNMQLENVSDNYQILRVAPLQIKTMLLENFDEQIARANAGLPATAFLKANSVTDKEVIEKISEASNAGVKVTLFVRGICCLVPGVKGATENVRVFSIVGRLLEHSRIYCFGQGDDTTIYLSSADLMTRNLNKRIEIAWPILDVDLRRRILVYLDICMHDTAKLRELRRNSTYTPLGAFCEIDEDGNARASFDSQNALIVQAAQAASMYEEAIASEGAGAEAAQEEFDSPVEGEAPQTAAFAEPEEAVQHDEPGEEAQPEYDSPMSFDNAPGFSAEYEQALAQAAASTQEREPEVTEPEALQPEAAELDMATLGDISTEAEQVAAPSFDVSSQMPMEEPIVEFAPTPIGFEDAPEPSAIPADLNFGFESMGTPEPAPMPIEGMPAEPAQIPMETVPAQPMQAPMENIPVGPMQMGNETLSIDAMQLPIEGESLEFAQAAAEIPTPDPVQLPFDSSAYDPMQAMSESMNAAPAQLPVEEFAGDSAYPQDFKLGNLDDVPPLDVPLPGASERIAELIDQLGTTPEQKAEPALEQLTDMKIAEIMPDDIGVQAFSDNQPQGTPSGMPLGTQESVADFFGQELRDIEIPPERKSGFFSRIRGDK